MFCIYLYAHVCISDNAENCSLVPEIDTYTFFPDSMSYFKVVNARPGLDWNAAMDTCHSAEVFRHLPWVNSKMRIDDVRRFLGIVRDYEDG